MIDKPIHVVLVHPVHSQVKFWIGNCTCGKEFAHNDREAVEAEMATCRAQEPTSKRWKGEE